MTMPGRKFTLGEYRYGFNGKEKDKDMDGNSYDYGFRIYNPALGRFLSYDPLHNEYHDLSPYHFAGDNPIRNLDVDGGEPKDYMSKWLYYALKNHDVLSNGKTGFYDPNDPGHLITVGLVYDAVTKQNWFIHEEQGVYRYWVMDNPGEKQHIRVSNIVGNSNGQWKVFETQEQRDAKAGAAIATAFGYMAVGIVTLPLITVASIPAVVDAGVTLVARVIILAYKHHKLITTLGTLGTGLIDPSGQSGNVASAVERYTAKAIGKFISTEEGAIFQSSAMKEIIKKGGQGLEDMMKDPIKAVLYNGERYILDGHNRLKAFEELGQDVNVTILSVEEATKSFPDKMKDILVGAFKKTLETEHE
jgi:RHS repeat-associated protein